MKEERSAPVIKVGILSAPCIEFTLNGIYMFGGIILPENTRLRAEIKDGTICLLRNGISVPADSALSLVPSHYNDSSFTVHAVIIGINFHWQRHEDQVFRGTLSFIAENEAITAINTLTVEDYLVSVISSEMKATSSMELLKAHSVVSRSWLLAQLAKNKNLRSAGESYETCFDSGDELVKWYDREDHLNYDVCADDHCQRYQGITRATTPEVEAVIDQTFGEVLTYDGLVCDTRFYKCCGGVTELFKNVWEPVDHPYIGKVVDNTGVPPGFNLNLESEENAVKWISESPPAFCNTTDTKILKQVLNDYDQETNDFYRWRVKYTRRDLSELVRRKTGIDFGDILSLEPLTRGVSGRITRLKITGTLRSKIIGKELEIRKALSPSHLYSSCFFVEQTGEGENAEFILKGAGWGHGVGLCQIGAAVMGTLGYSYRDILFHYFCGSTLETIY